MYPIFLAHASQKGDRALDRELWDYVRTEYRAADRPKAILSLRGAALLYPPRVLPKRPPRRLSKKLRRWIRSLRGSPGREIRAAERVPD